MDFALKDTLDVMVTCVGYSLLGLGITVLTIIGIMYFSDDE